MDRDTAQHTLDLLRSEHGEAHQAFLDAQRRLGALDKLIEGYIELFPELGKPAVVETTKEEAEKLGTTEAIQKVLHDAPGKWFTVPLMTKEIQALGWTSDASDPANTVRTTLGRLLESELHLKRDKGSKGGTTYSYRPFEAEVEERASQQPLSPTPTETSDA